MSLSQIEKGRKGRVEHVSAAGSIRRRFLDLGLTPGTWVECVGVSPLGDPAAYLVRGTVIALRRQEAECIRVWPGEPDAQAGDQKVQSQAGQREAPWD